MYFYRLCEVMLSCLQISKINLKLSKIMSATFKNAKQKLKQNELRKIMSEHKNKLQKSAKKIESPLAKYNESGQLTCILCKSVVRSEAVWNVHLNSKQHKENVEAAKKLKEKTNNFTTAIKRPATPPLEVPIKKLKGILKNSTSKTENNDTNQTDQLPDDFFDTKKSNLNLPQLGQQNQDKIEKEPEKMDVEQPDSALPEGFFDDPKLDAKARNLEYKDPVEEEWEKFQKEIRDADFESAAIIAEDQEEATNERQIDEIDEQIKNWSRVVNLEKKKVEVIGNVAEKDENMSVGDDEEVNEEDFDEFLDWRSKKSFV
ncbi:zinc finger protein 830 [Onthophagus taurus]|uniref:zinc finger protein 830 n=1 Tax=Onthophagus taurus TaxID=166361 RepID=UPI0039BDEDF7